MTKYVLALAIAAGAVSPAFADFYIVRGADKTCKVADAKPTDKTMTVVGDKAYKTKADAEKELKTACK
jgi:hypothetical protein